MMNQFIEVLPSRLYSAEESRSLDQLAIEEFNISGYALMKNAGAAIFNLLQEKFPLAKRILVCCGAGNNAGDGYVIARLAHKAGYKVSLLTLVEPGILKGDAEKAYQDWKSLGHLAVDFKPALLEKTDIVIDALLGTGLQRPVKDEWKDLIAQVNASSVPVISVDIPSGLSADTGSVSGIAIRADVTMSFMGLKKGMFTHQAVDHCGEIFFNDLGVPEGVYDDVVASAHLLVWDELKHRLAPRNRSSHKGNHGHVLVVGGNYAMAGAVRLAGEAALRSGAGLVTVVTRPEHVAALVCGRPELMVLGSEHGDIAGDLLHRVSAIIIGPGLGNDAWAKHLLSQVLQSKLPKLIDADALNLLSSQDGPDESWILTPHPGEAARLLDEDIPAIQDDRFTAIEMLQQTYGGTIVLKGAGSLVNAGDGVTAVCSYGNPGMATAGMGDVLSGIIAALLVQGYTPKEAACLGVVIHARAGDIAAAEAERGLIASDLFDSIRSLVNP